MRQYNICPYPFGPNSIPQWIRCFLVSMTYDPQFWDIRTPVAGYRYKHRVRAQYIRLSEPYPLQPNHYDCGGLVLFWQRMSDMASYINKVYILYYMCQNLNIEYAGCCSEYFWEQGNSNGLTWVRFESWKSWSCVLWIRLLSTNTQHLSVRPSGIQPSFAVSLVQPSITLYFSIQIKFPATGLKGKRCVKS